MLQWHKFTLLLIGLLAVQRVEVKELKWKYTVDFDDSTNWNGGGVVCANDRKKYPKNMTASIVIQRDESLQEMLLSDNMVVIIEEGAALTFTSQPNVISSPSGAVSGSSSNICIPKGRVLEFEATSQSWFNPNAWEAVPPTDQPSDLVDGPLASYDVFDLDRVPCGQDQPIFDSKHSFLVDMQNQPVQVAAISVHEENMISMDALNKYLDGERVKYEIINRNGITVSPSADCPAYKDRRNLICGNVKCPNVTGLCSHPVIPTIGQCCNACSAAIIYVTTNESAPLSFGQLAGLGEVEDVTLAIGPLVNSIYELLLTDNVSGTNANKAACTMAKHLEKNDHVRHVEAVLSDGVCGGHPTHKPSKKRQAHINFIIVGVASGCVLLIIILTIIGILLYCRKSPSKSKDGGFELGNVNVSSQGFDNPVYNAPALPYDDNFAIQYLPDEEQVHGFNSGMFSPDSGVSVSGSPKKQLENKLPPGEAATVSESKRTKKSKSSKEQKPKMETSFENPNYDAGPLPVKQPLPSDKNADSMIDVPLNEKSGRRATEKSEAPVSSSPDTKGIVNPLYGDDGSSASREESIEPVPQVSVADKKPSKKKKNKSKGGKSENGATYKSFENDDDPTETIESFQNPLYEQPFYQPNEDPSDSPQGDDA